MLWGFCLLIGWWGVWISFLLFFMECAYCQIKTILYTESRAVHSKWLKNCYLSCASEQDILATVSYWQMSLSNIFQTLKAQMFSECKISRASSTNIHLQMIPLMYLPPPRSYSALGNTRILKQFTKVSLHISTVHWCNWNNKFWVKTTDLFLECSSNLMANSIQSMATTVYNTYQQYAEVEMIIWHSEKSKGMVCTSKSALWFTEYWSKLYSVQRSTYRY